MISIDGSYGEGGGQILRSAVALATLSGDRIRIINIRAGRPNPGLQAQHLTCIHACAQICDAQVEGDRLHSQVLEYGARTSPRAGKYVWDVAKARAGGSAGAASLVLQSALLALAMADGDSEMEIGGGTHVPWSPPHHYLEYVYVPTLARMELEARVELLRWGWYPRGGGAIKAYVKGNSSPVPIDLRERGKLRGVFGLSVASNLPRHIAERQRAKAMEILKKEGLEPRIDIEEAVSGGPGTMIFLTADSDGAVAGFSSLGAKGKPAEKVGEEAAFDLLSYYRSGAALDEHLADQLLLPMALANGDSFTTCRISRHLLTNIWLVGRLLGVDFQVEGGEGEKGLVKCRRRAHV